MIAINDNKIYLDGMRNTFHDKCWFMSIIPDDVETILDVGCADGSFLEFLKSQWKDYKYVGVDMNPQFIAKCKEKGFDCFENLAQAANHLRVLGLDPRRTLVVMNSVLHEVYSYSGREAAENLWKVLMRNGFKYIALRDMYAKGCGTFSSKTEKEIQDILMKDKGTASNTGGFIKLNEKFEDFEKIWGPVLDGYQFTHFLLKYFYDYNWERESTENYLPFYYRELHEAIREAGYDVTFENFYTLPWLKQKWMADWDCDTHPALGVFIRQILTHMKLFLVANEN